VFFTPQRFDTAKTHSCYRRCAPIAAQHWLERPGVRSCDILIPHHCLACLSLSQTSSG